MAKLLIVDDDLDLIDMLSNYFLLKGYEIYTAYDGKEALDKMKYTPDLVILDVNMPKLNGIDVCKRIRDFTQSPILFLTARATEEDKVNGLLVGGDDYIVKPFSVRELEARIVSNLKREERSKYSHKMIYTGSMSIDLISMEVFINGQRLDLTKKEYEIIELLALHERQIFSKEHIFLKLWNEENDSDIKVVTEYIRRIRKKIYEFTDENFIETEWGSGYRWKSFDKEISK